MVFQFVVNPNFWKILVYYFNKQFNYNLYTSNYYYKMTWKTFINLNIVLKIMVIIKNKLSCKYKIQELKNSKLEKFIVQYSCFMLR